MHSVDVMKIVQRSWKKMSDSQKQVYNDLSRDNRIEYEQKRLQFD